MPITVEKLFKQNNKTIRGQTIWGGSIEFPLPGVYVVAISPIAGEMQCYPEAPISSKRINDWIEYVPGLVIDGSRATVEKLSERIGSFWLPDETILYIGKAGASLQTRIKQYYDTFLGDRRPHRGGHWIKTLEIMETLTVYWTDAEDAAADELEARLISSFISSVSKNSRKALFDPCRPFPFANLEYPKGNRKKHGIRYQVN